jgi:tRNA synthetases class II (D, K and N)
LEQKLKDVNIDLDTLDDYLDEFRWGCPPHGGGGVGLERVVMLTLQLNDVRWANLFPKDPKSFAQNSANLAETSVTAAGRLLLPGPESKAEENTKDLPPLEDVSVCTSANPANY